MTWLPLVAAALIVSPRVSAARLQALTMADGRPRREAVRSPMIAGLLAVAIGIFLAVVTRSAFAVVALAAVAAAFGLTRLRGRHAAEDPMDVAAALDLMASALRAGLPVAVAAGAVATVAPPSLATALRRAAELLALGADPIEVWGDCGGAALEPLARLARRSARSGASLADGVAELARDARAEARNRADAAAERSGVLISGPLGLCFLPAFVCLGIVPVVIGLAEGVLGDGVLAAMASAGGGAP